MTPLIDEEAIAKRVNELAADLAAHVTDEWTLVALLQGAMPFAVDLMRALARRGINPTLDSLWLESYRDERQSSGRVVVRADISRPIAGKRVLLLDDVFDSGRTIAFARAHLLAKGAIETRACAAVAQTERNLRADRTCRIRCAGRFSGRLRHGRCRALSRSAVYRKSLKPGLVVALAQRIGCSHLVGAEMADPFRRRAGGIVLSIRALISAPNRKRYAERKNHSISTNTPENRP